MADSFDRGVSQYSGDLQVATSAMEA